jgi:hypothetical protein
LLGQQIRPWSRGFFPFLGGSIHFQDLNIIAGKKGSIVIVAQGAEVVARKCGIVVVRAWRVFQIWKRGRQDPIRGILALVIWPSIVGPLRSTPLVSCLRSLLDFLEEATNSEVEETSKKKKKKKGKKEKEKEKPILGLPLQPDQPNLTKRRIMVTRYPLTVTHSRDCSFCPHSDPHDQIRQLS